MTLEHLHCHSNLLYGFWRLTHLPMEHRIQQHERAHRKDRNPKRWWAEFHRHRIQAHSVHQHICNPQLERMIYRHDRDFWRRLLQSIRL